MWSLFFGLVVAAGIVLVLVALSSLNPSMPPEQGKITLSYVGIGVIAVGAIGLGVVKYKNS